MAIHDSNRRRSRRASELRRSIGADLRRHRIDPGLSLRRVAEAAGISASHLCEIELGRVEPSLPVLIAIGDVLGVDVSFRAFPTTGPRIRDHLQARIVEELLRVAHPRWRGLPEIPVYRPARGIVDVVLHDPDTEAIVACEVHSAIRRLEQQIGWARLKAESIPSAEFHRFVDPKTTVSRLLVLRSTRSTRELAIRFEETLRAAYPASIEATHAALVGPIGTWPDGGLLWAEVDGARTRILDRPPRNVRLGR